MCVPGGALLGLLTHLCCSVPGVYGVVTMPFSVREGINIFLEGFVPTENLRFREISLSFKVCVCVWFVCCGRRCLTPAV